MERGSGRSQPHASPANHKEGTEQDHEYSPQKKIDAALPRWQAVCGKICGCRGHGKEEAIHPLNGFRRKAVFLGEVGFKNPEGYEAEAGAFGGAPGPLITRLSELSQYSARLK
jgi:hypothetical protein